MVGRLQGPISSEGTIVAQSGFGIACTVRIVFFFLRSFFAHCHIFRSFLSSCRHAARFLAPEERCFSAFLVSSLSLSLCTDKLELELGPDEKTPSFLPPLPFLLPPTLVLFLLLYLVTYLLTYYLHTSPVDDVFLRN